MYLINYISGSKGDFLTNYLNEQSLFLDNYNNCRSYSMYQIDVIQNNHELFLKFKNHYSNLQFVNTHFAADIDRVFLQKNNIKLVHINFDIKHLPTIYIEGLLKTAQNNKRFFEIDQKKQVVNFFLKEDENYYKWQKIMEHKKIIVDKIPLHDNYSANIDKIVFKCDFKLLENNLEINDENRFKYYEKLLKTNPKNIENITYQWFFKMKKTLKKNDIVLQYEDIYLQSNLETLKKIKLNFCENTYLNLLEQTWLPKDFNLFGKKINPYDYGYRNFL